jgi:hypothetical protein
VVSAVTDAERKKLSEDLRKLNRDSSNRPK